MSIESAEEQAPPTESLTAEKLVEAWCFKGKDSKGHQSSQSNGAGSENGKFFAMTGTLRNSGTYEDAWNFYANKCHVDERYSDRTWIVGRPMGDGYLAVFQRTVDGRRSTTFALYQPKSTVSVVLVELDSSPVVPLLQLSVVVNMQ
jgi:hypothetical protein